MPGAHAPGFVVSRLNSPLGFPKDDALGGLEGGDCLRDGAAEVLGGVGAAFANGWAPSQERCPASVVEQRPDQKIQTFTCFRHERANKVASTSIRAGSWERWSQQLRTGACL